MMYFMRGERCHMEHFKKYCHPRRSNTVGARGWASVLEPEQWRFHEESRAVAVGMRVGIGAALTKEGKYDSEVE